MKINISSVVKTSLFFLFFPILLAEAQEDLVKYINPLIGSNSSPELSHGNTYPAIALPFGMTFWSPQTGDMNNGWIYTYNAKTIQGIRATHQPSPWIGDYGSFSLMGITGELNVNGKKRASAFKHQTEVSNPYYYKVNLENYKTLVEATATERCGYLQFTFPESKNSYMLLDAFNGGSNIKIIPEKNKIIGYSKNYSHTVPDNFALYFVAVFDKPIKNYGTWLNDTILKNTKDVSGNHAGGYIQFKTKQGDKIGVKIGTSFISLEQAELNLQKEIDNASFEQVKEKSKKVWNDEMNKIAVQGGTDDQKKIFYSSLYRVLLFPRMFYELKSDNKPHYFSPYDGEIHDGYMYTDNGFWDTFRAVFPFFTIMYPERTAEIMQGLVNTYKEGGHLPSWASPGYVDCMIGAHAASLITDAYLKGIKDFDIHKAYEAMIKDATVKSNISGTGRKGVDEYNKFGYVPTSYRESCAMTLEYAYDDFCISQLAKALNKHHDENLYSKHAKNYQNVYDGSTNFMRGRTEDGSWSKPFNPFSWGYAYTEGNAWHYVWSVFHDVQGLINLMGGKEAFTAKLDSVFILPPKAEYSYYGVQIHEITEMINGKMGQYAHGNQPIQHMIYLYNYAGQPWKAQKWVREVMTKLYGSGPDGYCGDEDNGQTSVWYVMSAMGFYPVTPGVPAYVFGSPLFDKITLKLPKGKEFVVQASGNSATNVYIQSSKLNNDYFTKNWISHSDIVNGGKLEFVMGAIPNKTRGITSADYPFSVTEKEACSIPFPILDDSECQGSELFIKLGCRTGDSKIRYTLDGSEPKVNSPVYVGEIKITETTKLRAKAFKPGLAESETFSFNKPHFRKPVNVENSKAGLNYDYYEGVWNALPEFTKLKPVESGNESNFIPREINKKDNFGYCFRGFVNIMQEGSYTFYLNSDDGSKLYIGDDLIVNNDGQHGLAEKSGKVNLMKGFHPIKVEYFDSTGDHSLEVSYSGCNLKKQTIPSNMLYRKSK